MAHCCPFEYNGQRRGPIVSHLPRASSSPSPKDLPLPVARASLEVSVCLFVLFFAALFVIPKSAVRKSRFVQYCIASSVLYTTPSHASTPCSHSRYEITSGRSPPSYSTLPQRASARQPWQPWSRQNRSRRKNTRLTDKMRNEKLHTFVSHSILEKL